jgi:hypothetical protein
MRTSSTCRLQITASSAVARVMLDEMISGSTG